MLWFYSRRTALRTALCESIRYQAKSEQNVRQDLIQGAPRGGCSHAPLPDGYRSFLSLQKAWVTLSEKPETVSLKVLPCHVLEAAGQSKICRVLWLNCQQSQGKDEVIICHFSALIWYSVAGQKHSQLHYSCDWASVYWIVFCFCMKQKHELWEMIKNDKKNHKMDCSDDKETVNVWPRDYWSFLSGITSSDLSQRSATKRQRNNVMPYPIIQKPPCFA